MFGCNYQKNENNDNLSEAQKEYLSTEVDRVNKGYVDSSTTTRELFTELTLESELIYQFMNKKTAGDFSKICSKFKNKTIIINITVKDTLIIEGTGKVYEFDTSGNLISYEDRAPELVELFVNEDAKKFDFIDSYKLAYFEFRVETERICK